MGRSDTKSSKNQFDDFVNLFDTSVVKMQEKFKRMHTETEQKCIDAIKTNHYKVLNEVQRCA